MVPGGRSESWQYGAFPTESDPGVQEVAPICFDALGQPKQNPSPAIARKRAPLPALAMLLSVLGTTVWEMKLRPWRFIGSRLIDPSLDQMWP